MRHGESTVCTCPQCVPEKYATATLNVAPGPSGAVWTWLSWQCACCRSQLAPNVAVCPYCNPDARFAANLGGSIYVHKCPSPDVPTHPVTEGDS